MRQITAYVAHRHSGVAAYTETQRSITIYFQGYHSCYTYTYASAGRRFIRIMKFLARRGSYLQAFINKHNPGFSKKEMI